MDERIHEHARVLVDWSARLERGDDVVVRVGEGAHDGEFAADPEYELALYESADSVLTLKGTHNTAETADVPADRRQAYRRTRQGVREARLATDWVSTQHPTRAMAQQAGMAFGAYADFVYDATLRDWESLAAEMDRLKRILDEGSEARIVNEGTDLTLFVDDRTAVNSAASVAYDSHNLPSGEVFTAPHDTAGVVTFDVPVTVDGQRVRDVIREVVETDGGSRRLGELGVGMNRGIDRPTGDIMFDEKMAGTVHLALGRAYDACLPEGESGNDSAVHVDLITDMTGDSRIEVDGEVVQRDGVFRWEDGFGE